MEKIAVIKKEVEELLRKIIDDFELKVEDKNGSFYILIQTNKPAVIIGRHGETIRALQRIVEVILFKIFGQPQKILLDVNDFRKTQKEKLETLAYQHAEKVLQTKTPSTISGLSSYERKIIHEYIAKNYPQLTTLSLGKGKFRRLNILLKENAII